MLADEFTNFVRRTPFRPYRIVMSDGQAYDIFHTDFALVLYDATLKSRSWTKASSRNPVFLRGSVEKADF